MKNFLYGCLVGAMVIFIVYTLFDGAAREQEERELAALDKIEQAKVGSHFRVNGVGLLKTSHHAGRVE